MAHLSMGSVVNISTGGGRDNDFTVDGLLPESGYSYAIVDGADHLALGVRTDGTVYANMPDRDARVAAVEAVLPDRLSAESGFTYAVVDTDDNLALGVRADGTVYAHGLTEAIDALEVTVGTTDGRPSLPSSRIVFWGDSMTAGAGGGGTTISSVVASELGRTVVNRGIGGQNSASIAARQGGVETLLTVTSNTIPTSGGVTVTARSVSPITSQGTQSFTGTLAGVHGTLSRDSGDVYTFTRTTDGASTACPAATPFLFDEATTYEADTVVIWVGRNNVGAATEARDHALAMVDRLTPVTKRVLVIGVCNGEGETYSPTGYLATVNGEMGRVFGDQFLDMRAWMVDRGLGEMGITATSDDTADIAAGVIPESLRSDNVHFNADGYTAAGRYISRVLRAKGW